MSQQVNKLLILALGIAIGIIVILVMKPDGSQADSASIDPSLQSSPGARLLPTPAEPGNPTAVPRQIQPMETADEPLPSPSDTLAFEEEMKRVLRGEASEEEQLAFWQGAATSKRLDALIADLQAAAGEDSEDIVTRLSLAQAYVTKIWSSPAGPEQGLWAAKAETAWREVLKIAPDNWDAQRSIAFSYSQYPDFVNKTGDAIAEYEKTVALQEAAPEPKARFAKSYLELAKLHIKNGDPSSALATLEQGTSSHPEDTDLAEQLQVISSSYRFEEVGEE
ncbi:MAG: hypothetical protein ACI9R3_003283 [Verrucomicrobiales bacterium]|jgi:hypothetical protein